MHDVCEGVGVDPTLQDAFVPFKCDARGFAAFEKCFRATKPKPARRTSRSDSCPRPSHARASHALALQRIHSPGYVVDDAIAPHASHRTGIASQCTKIVL